MTQEQRENADKLENIRDQLRKQADLLNLAGYKCSAYELKLIDVCAHLAHELQKLARM